ncbi:MAG: MFS transporter, partial [Actinomycetota bacterium]|nr:MFS transporter [Actinomycetota bacterium]
MADGSTVRWGTAPARWVLFVTVLGSALGFLDATVVNVALPTIGRDLDAGVADLQWTVNGYLLTLAALILLGGALGDRYGRRLVFSVGVVVFTIASALCAFAPTVDVLVAARVVQGIGGALLTPGSLAIIEASFRAADRPRAIGAWSALGGVATAFGPVLGGWLIDAVSWRAIFFINLPLGVLVVLAAARHVPETRDATATGRPDALGAVLVTVGLGGSTFALIAAPERGLASAVVLVALVAGVVGLVAFLLVERRIAHPMLPLDVFASRQFAVANVLTLVVYAALGGVLFLLAVFLQGALGFSPLAAGAATLPITALMLALSAHSGALAQAVGPRRPLTVGPLLLAGGMLLMTRIDPGDEYVTAVLPALVVFGLGLVALVAPVTATVLAAADERHAGVASGINNAVARAAQLLAVAVLPVAAGLSGADYADADALADAFHTAMLISAALALAGAAIAWAGIRDDVLDRGEGELEARPHADGAGAVVDHPPPAVDHPRPLASR